MNNKLPATCFCAALGFMIMTPAHSASQGLDFHVTADIKAGTCYFTSTALDYFFGDDVYPAAIANSDKAQRPHVDKQVVANYSSNAPDPYDRYMTCDPSSTSMNFSITTANAGKGLEGQDVILLDTTTGVATNVGISIERVNGTTITPIKVNDAPVNVGAQGTFTLRATLNPLQGKAVSDITGGDIKASAVLNITYQ